MPYITDNFQVESFYQNFEEDYSSEDQLYERIEDIQQQEECPECGETIEICKCYSVCCGAEIILHDICSQCFEHV
jgi:hypothetical protein